MGCRNARRVKLSVCSSGRGHWHNCDEETMGRAVQLADAKSPGWWARASRLWRSSELLNRTGSGIQHRLGSGGFRGSGNCGPGRRWVRPGASGNIVGGGRANARRSSAGRRDAGGGTGTDARRGIPAARAGAADDATGVRNRIHGADGRGHGGNSGHHDRLRALLDSARGIIPRCRDARPADHLDVRRHIRSPGRDGGDG